MNAVTAGITIGCIYDLTCIGLGVIFGMMRIVNFAQGEQLMLGMFVSLDLVSEDWVLSFLLTSPARPPSIAEHAR